MAFNLGTGRVRLGLAPGDSSRDVEIQAGLDAALALAEKYCDRQFAYKNDVAKFYHVYTSYLPLTRYPIDSILSVKGNTSKYQVHRAGGWIEFHSTNYIEEIEINYSGGFKTFPADLELALWSVFDSASAAMTAGGGGAVSGGIKTVAVTGVGSISYDTGSGGSSSSGGAFGGLIPEPATRILDLYVRQKA